MPKYTINVITGKPIGNLYRDRHVLILVQNKEGNFLLGEKADFYAETYISFARWGNKS